MGQKDNTEVPSNRLESARAWDDKDPLSKLRERFHLPTGRNGKAQLYFTGHSLGLMPKKTEAYLHEEMQAWSQLGVEGHHHGQRPWLPYHENVTASLARLVGAKESEVVAMNSLTVNLHLMMVSFYQPKGSRTKILIENNTFPSDKYAVDSQAKFHGLDPAMTVVELKPTNGFGTVDEESLLQQIAALGDELALVMLGNCNYLSGQRFPFEKIAAAAHRVGAKVGFNLAHGAGNLHLKLHEWNVDFAVWCSYKYLNSGPGAIAGAFVHEKHHNRDLPRFSGWWGTNKKNRFLMKPEFEPIPSVEAWQLSNPPIFQLAVLRASLDIFDEVGMEKLRARGDLLTGYLEKLLIENCDGKLEVITPSARGSMLSVRVNSADIADPKKMLEHFKGHDALLDFREPNILRMAPAALYNSFEDVFLLASLIGEALR